MAGLGPAPFCGMMLADHGAEVIRVERPGDSGPREGQVASTSVLNRSRRCIVLDLKEPDGVRVLLDLAGRMDGLIEGFRPGVMERFGLGPDTLISRNPRLVYGRMTGWGQTGPYAGMAGHDINYLAVSGVLSLLGREGSKPTPPANLLADFGGGGMLLAFGMVAALLHARISGQGQVVDCSMVEGAALLSGMICGFRAQGRWSGERGQNFLDTGAHYYEVYECADGRYVSIAALEPKFYAELRRVLGLTDDREFDDPDDKARWPVLKRKMAAVFITRTREQWCGIFKGKDACFAPVLSMDEAAVHPHNVSRNSFVSAGGVMQPAPAPRWSSGSTTEPRMPTEPGRDTEDLLREMGYEPARIAGLVSAGIVE